MTEPTETLTDYLFSLPDREVLDIHTRSAGLYNALVHAAHMYAEAHPGTHGAVFCHASRALFSAFMDITFLEQEPPP